MTGDVWNEFRLRPSSGRTLAHGSLPRASAGHRGGEARDRALCSWISEAVGDALEVLKPEGLLPGKSTR